MCNTVKLCRLLRYMTDKTMFKLLQCWENTSPLALNSHKSICGANRSVSGCNNRRPHYCKKQCKMADAGVCCRINFIVADISVRCEQIVFVWRNQNISERERKVSSFTQSSGVILMKWIIWGTLAALRRTRQSHGKYHFKALVWLWDQMFFYIVLFWRHNNVIPMHIFSCGN